ncbi:phosphoribosylglycinamide formyltransferase [Sporanaerobacter acetigenes]|uniref:Phosphoribosylglycinamide formyltransferase n=1 Tax=Sporanaerobacter acetigenes DSM 13106 TaxID=1123281 RepID=A0A1M5S4H4_9FIRM|nr:phosphoribosylglycinamide formyltransferase [Sporanaerobacter acetigenes]SHH33384.1 formyltetrahydrofolate-dependent phosphoribosylglycinamide formyltransferase [Sporanaerobacter acetigenes DSM 13106]
MQPVKIGVLISGGGTNLQCIIDKVKNGYINGEISLVLSNKKDAYGLVRAKREGIDAIWMDRKKYSTEEEYNDAIIEEFKNRDIELVVLAGYLKVLSKKFVTEYKGRIINIHPSLIPSFCGSGYYGERVHREVLKYGVKFSGATVHFVDEGTDTGPIILQRIVQVKDDDTVESLKERVLKVEHEILPEAVKYFCDGKILLDGRKVIIMR